MTEQDQIGLGRTLWAVADELRGAMNADDFRDYMLSFLFLRYLIRQLRTGSLHRTWHRLAVPAAKGPPVSRGEINARSRAIRVSILRAAGQESEPTSRRGQRIAPLVEWCPGAESNHRHEDFQSTALPLSYPGTVSGRSSPPWVAVSYKDQRGMSTGLARFFGYLVP